MNYICTLQHISCALSIVVAIGYWGAKAFSGYASDGRSIHEHGISMLLCNIDLFLSRNELRSAATIHKPLITVGAYVAFTAILQLAFDIQIYAEIDWQAFPGQTA
eukprot:576179_1